MNTVTTILAMNSRPEYDLLNEDDFNHFCEMLAIQPDNMRGGFALIHEGSILELYGFTGFVPDLYKPLEFLYSESICNEIDHCYFAIGQLCKTRRYPKRLITFRRAVWNWIQENKPGATPANVQKYAYITAFNAGWTNVSGLEWNGVERDSLWLTR